MKLSSKFIAVASLMVTSALSSGVQAQQAGINVDASDIQSRLNLGQNTFYHPGAGVRIDEVCKAKPDVIQCDMTFINGGHNRVQTGRMNYQTDTAGHVADMTASSDKVQYYTANGSFKDNNTNTATSGHYDELTSAASRPDLDAKIAEAKSAGHKTPYDYIISRIGNSDSYFTAGNDMTAIETAMAQENIFAYDGKYRPLDRLVRLNDIGNRAVSEVGCILVPPANTPKPAYDVDIEQSSRALCITKDFRKGSMDDKANLSDFERYGSVTTTYSMYVLGVNDNVIGAGMGNKKVFGETALGATSQHDQNGYDATQHGLIDPSGTRQATGNRIRPAL